MRVAIMAAVEHGERALLLARAGALHLEGELVLTLGEVHHDELPGAMGIRLGKPKQKRVVVAPP